MLRNTTKSSGRITASDPTRVHDALAPHQRLRLESDRDVHRRTPLAWAERGSSGVLWRQQRPCAPRGLDVRSRSSSARENVRVERRSPRARHDDTAAAVRGDVAARARRSPPRPMSAAAKRRLQQCQQTSGILADELGHLRRRNREQLPALGNGSRQSVRFEPAQAPRRARPRCSNSNCRPASQPKSRERSTTPGVDAGDLRRLPQLLDPCVDVLSVVGDGVAVGGREHDVQLIERAETREKLSKGRRHAAVLRQKRQDVGVEREPADAFDGDEHHAASRRRARPHAGGSPRRRCGESGERRESTATGQSMRRMRCARRRYGSSLKSPRGRFSTTSSNTIVLVSPLANVIRIAVEEKRRRSTQRSSRVIVSRICFRFGSQHELERPWPFALVATARRRTAGAVRLASRLAMYFCIVPVPMRCSTPLAVFAPATTSSSDRRRSDDALLGIGEAHGHRERPLHGERAMGDQRTREQ